MTVTMRIAHRKYDLVVEPDGDDLDAFAGRGYLALYDAEGTLTLVRDDTDGACLYDHGLWSRGERQGPQWIYKFRVRDYRKEDWTVERSVTWAGLEDLPKFALHEVEFKETEDGDLVWVLPPAYLLPWPFSNPSSAMSKYFPEEAAEDLLVRARSAYEAGVSARDFVADVPRYVKSRVQADDWVAMIETFRGEREKIDA